MCKNHIYPLILVLVLMGLFGLALRAPRIEASGTIYIRANGSVEGTDKITSADNVTYVFTDNVNDSIVVERSNIAIDGDGYTVQGSGSGNGFYWRNIDNVTIKSAKIEDFDYGVYIWSSTNSTVSGNNMTNNFSGISLRYSNNSVVSGNTITNCASAGVIVFDTCNNTVISGNAITNTYTGVDLSSSNNSVVSGNIITNSSGTGVGIWSSDNSLIFGNTIANGNYGVFLDEASNNKIYHNNFINNTYPADASADSLNNVWDDGYPSGGNYWSDYSDVDIFSGPYQNQTGSDGIWDHPYIINAYNEDKYPIVPEFSPYLMIPSFMIATLLAVTVCKRKQ